MTQTLASLKQYFQTRSISIKRLIYLLIIMKISASTFWMTVMGKWGKKTQI